MTTTHCSLFPEVSPNQNLLDHVLLRSESLSESSCMCPEDPPLPGKTTEETPSYSHQPSTKMDLQRDADAKTCLMSETSMCRICHDGGVQEELLSPCECSGSLSSVHRSCLERWLSASGTSICELCQYQFTVKRRSRSLLEWIQTYSLRQEKRTLFGDLVCFLLITPLASVSGWLCLRGAIDHLRFSSRMEAIGLITLTVALFSIYLFWTLVSLKYHCRLYKEWRSSNQRVIIVLPHPHSQVSVLNPLQSSQSRKTTSKESIV